MKTNILPFLISIAILVVPIEAISQDQGVSLPEIEYPFCGRSTGSSLNVRSGPNLNFEILTKLYKSEQVLVFGKKLDWYEIELPVHGACFISKNFVDKEKGMITGKRVNIRAGAGLNYSILGQLNEDDLVEVVDEVNGWCMIRPPKKVRGWVHSDYIEYHAGPERYIAQKEKESLAAVKFSEIEKSYELEIQKPPSEQDFSKLLKRYHHFMETYLESGAIEAAKLKVDEISMKVQELRAVGEGIDKKEKIVTAQGLVKDMGRVYNRPGTHKLTHDRNVLYYLKSSELDLNRYGHRRVVVTGRVKYLADWPHPLLTVSKIEPLTD